MFEGVESYTKSLCKFSDRMKINCVEVTWLHCSVDIFSWDNVDISWRN